MSNEIFTEFVMNCAFVSALFCCLSFFLFALYNIGDLIIKIHLARKKKKAEKEQGDGQ